MCIRDSSGTAVHGSQGTIMNIIGCFFSHNRVTAVKVYRSIRGGTVYCEKCQAIINSSTFEHNKANHYGGAVLVVYGYIILDSCGFNSNEAEIGGGFYATYRTEAYIYGSTTFEYNVALYGAAAHAFLSTLTVVCNLTIINNTAQIGIIGVIHSTVSLGNNLLFSENSGSIFAYSGEITITGKATLSNNSHVRQVRDNEMDDSIMGFDFSHGGGGGGITLFGSRLMLHGSIVVKHNTANNGGGILATTSTIICNCSLRISSNTAINTGGGMYLYQSELSINEYVEFNGNRAMKHGGGLHAISTLIKLIRTLGRSRVPISKMNFTSNLATSYGGGMYFESGSKMYVFRYKQYSVIFINNTADYGGAIYIADDTNMGACLDPINHSQSIIATQSECFFQLSSIVKTSSKPTIEKAFHFAQNCGKHSGGDLFGGLLDRCTVNNFDKSIKYSTLQGFADSILNSTSSKPVRVCLCDSKQRADCGLEPTPITVKKDKKFILKIAAVDQVNCTVNATVCGYVTDNQASLGEGQTVQDVEAGCSDLVFSIVSPRETAELVIYAKGPCRDLGISQLRVSIKFMSCSCPLGFEQNKVIKNKCHCICHHKLKQALKFVMDTDCNSTTLLLTKNRNFWVTYATNTTLLTCNNCPTDYCHPAPPPIHIDLTTPDGADVQCKFNRSGNLCGGCELGLTLSLGSSQCIECPYYWPALFCLILVSALLAGIAVVVFMLVLNLTVARGTLNAIIFYANVLAGNQALFLPFESTNFQRIFIAWLNLDVGFDVCFVKGLDMYFKVWLQLLFPLYLIFLVVAVILACKYSIRFAKSIGKRNPVATLATLILLSYARLLQNTINILSYTALQYTSTDSNYSFEKVMWLSDASLPYLSGRHIPLFIAAVLILLIGVPYTILLTGWQWLIRLPNRTAFKWMRNAKLASFMDAYHAPYVPRNRYWTGLLLLSRVVLYLIAAVNVSGEPRVNLLAVSLVIGSMFLLHAYSGMHIYKRWVLDAFEFTTYFNILAFAVTKFYALQSDSDHIIIAITLSSISIGFQFVVFICTLMYHAEIECNIIEG